MHRKHTSLCVGLLTSLLLLLFTMPALGNVAGAACLQIPPGARANGLGEAYVALADDATAAWWNPAGLGFMERKTLGFMHSNLVPDLFNDIYYEYMGWVHNIGEWGTYGISLVYLSYGESPHTVDSPEAEGYFSSYEFSPALSYGIKLDDKTTIGLNIKYIRVVLAPEWAVLDPFGSGEGSSVAVDAGLMRKLLKDRAQFGVALTNFGPNITFIDEEQSDPLPRHIKLGAMGYFYQGEYGHILGTVDYNKMIVSGGPTTINGGVELQYIDIMALRLGYVNDPDGDIQDFTVGGGFHVKLGSTDFLLDYASIPQASDLERVHRFSFEIGF